SFFSWSSRSASYSSRSSRCDMRGSVYPGKETLDRPLSRDFQLRSKLGEGAEYECALVKARVRDAQAGLVDLRIAVQQQVEIERPRAARATGRNVAVRSRSVYRRLSIVVVAASCALAMAAAAAGDTPAEWWLHTIDADTVTAPGPGVPIVVVDGAVDASQPSFTG